MKKITAMLLGLALLFCAVLAGAEGDTELPYLETESQDVYISDTVLTEASYPQVCISPYSAYDLFARNKVDPWYVTFPVPEGMRCDSFRADEANFLLLDANNACEYYYKATDRYSYESFLLDCPNKDNILLDGSEKIAAYFNPDRARAEALFGLDEIQEGAKLYVNIHVQRLGSKEDAEKAEILKTKIMDEIERLKGNMSFVKMDKFWTNGTYKGVKLYGKSIPGNYLIVDLPEIDFHLTKDGIGGQVFPTAVNRQTFECNVSKDRECAVTIEYSADTFSYVFYNRDEAEIQKATLSDGNEWGIYVANERDGQPYSVYASRLLNTPDSNGDALYLTVQINASNTGAYWPDLDTFIQDLNVIVQGVHTAE